MKLIFTLLILANVGLIFGGEVRIRPSARRYVVLKEEEIERPERLRPLKRLVVIEDSDDYETRLKDLPVVEHREVRVERPQEHRHPAVLVHEVDRVVPKEKAVEVIRPKVIQPEIAVYEDAHIQVDDKGYVLDSEDVARAKAIHFAAKEKAAREMRPKSIEPEIAVYEDAHIQVDDKGYVLDSEDVARAKAIHFAAKEKAIRERESAPKVSTIVSEVKVVERPKITPAVEVVKVVERERISRPKPVHFAKVLILESEPEEDFEGVRVEVEHSKEAEVVPEGRTLNSEVPTVPEVDTFETKEVKIEPEGRKLDAEVDTFKTKEVKVVHEGRKLDVDPIKPEINEANIEVDDRGYLKESPEVAAASARHLLAKEKVLAAKSLITPK